MRGRREVLAIIRRSAGVGFLHVSTVASSKLVVSVTRPTGTGTVVPYGSKMQYFEKSNNEHIFRKDRLDYSRLQ